MNALQTADACRRDVEAELGAALDRMIAIQATAYPTHWSAADKRELAEQHLFGERVS
jgi:hypothetical protein